MYEATTLSLISLAEQEVDRSMFDRQIKHDHEDFAQSLKNSQTRSQDQRCRKPTNWLESWTWTVRSTPDEPLMTLSSRNLLSRRKNRVSRAQTRTLGATLRPMGQVQLVMRLTHAASTHMSHELDRTLERCLHPDPRKSDTLVNSSSRTLAKLLQRPHVDLHMWAPSTFFSSALFGVTSLMILVKNALPWLTVLTDTYFHISSPTCWEQPSNAKVYLIEEGGYLQDWQEASTASWRKSNRILGRRRWNRWRRGTTWMRQPLLYGALQLHL